MLNRYQQFINESSDKDSEIREILAFLLKTKEYPFNVVRDVKDVFINAGLNSLAALIEMFKNSSIRPGSDSIVNELEKKNVDSLTEINNNLKKIEKFYISYDRKKYIDFVNYVLHESTTITDTIGSKPITRYGFYRDEMILESEIRPGKGWCYGILLTYNNFGQVSESGYYSNFPTELFSDIGNFLSNIKSDGYEYKIQLDKEEGLKIIIVMND